MLAGTNALMSMGLSSKWRLSRVYSFTHWTCAVLMLLLWYCHKRGREVRLEHEAAEAAKLEGTEAPGLVKDVPNPADGEAKLTDGKLKPTEESAKKH